MAALASLQSSQRPAEDQGPSLGEVLRPEIVAPLLREGGGGLALERLAEFLPAEHRCEEGGITRCGVGQSTLRSFANKC